jgi:transcriptional regulator with XRE-family HTH domain
MATTAKRAVVKFNHQRMAEDMTERGWTRAEFARQAGVADMTVYRFLDGLTQTEPVAKKLCDALGFSVRRYLVGQDVAPDDSQLELPLPQRSAVAR